MRRIFGLWLLTGVRSFEDRRIFREDREGAMAQTPFQRRVGVRYVGRRWPRSPDSQVGFGSFVRGGRPRSVLQAFKGHFERPLRPQHLALKTDHLSVLRRATGYALIASPHLRKVSLHHAHFAGIVRVNDEDAS